MLRSFLKITLRILWRNKVTSFINIFSLSIGITAFILIMLYVHHEMSYDKFNENYNRIYRLEASDYGRLPPIIGTYVKEQMPEIEKFTRLYSTSNNPIIYSPIDNPENQKQIEIKGIWADSSLFDLFSFSFIQGDPKIALVNPFTAVLTESTANKLFGDKNPIGETLVYRDVKFAVTGIIRDVHKSHFKIEALFSYGSFDRLFKDKELNKTNASLWSAMYLLMADDTDSGLVEEKINHVLAEINNSSMIKIVFQKFHIRPLKDLYFNGSVANLQFGQQGNLKLVRIFMAVAALILMLACINYINLTSARALLRTREVAMKKIAGSSKVLLWCQFLSESILVTLIAFSLSFTLVQMSIPGFNQLAMVNISLIDFNTPFIWLLVIPGVLFLGIISGVYPAYYLTRIRSVSLIKGAKLSGSTGSLFRKALLTFQFSISILLVIGLVTNLKQLNYAKTKDLGFNKEQIITIWCPSLSDDKISLNETIKERLLQNSHISNLSFSGIIIGEIYFAGIVLEIDGSKRYVRGMAIDPDYLDLLEIEIVEGRGFSWERQGYRYPSEKFGLIFNETAAKQFWNGSPVGKIYNYSNSRFDNLQFEVIGVAQDFHFNSLHHKIEPTLMYWDNSPNKMYVKISPFEIPTTIQYIKKQWEDIYGSYTKTPFSYTFLDETFDQQYKSDEQVAKIIGYFTILAIIIACMGLFALSSFMVVRRTKEIGIRKAMGASVENIFLLLSKEFIKWVLIAVIIACPIAWFLMDKWLQGFAYRINLGVDIFLIAALISLVIALATVAWQSLKSALENPINALRYE